MIPKKIHYVWVGGNEKSKQIKRCMKTWEKHLEGYEIIEWNEDNFHIDEHPFVKAAYQAKKWAYVSDYIRAYVIYHYGGIYLDTDVLILDNFDSFLEHKAFVGFENPQYPFTAVFGAEKEHLLVKDMLEYYDKLNTYEFDFNNNNTISVSDILIKKYGCKTGNQFQILKEDIVVYPDTVLCNPSQESVSIHVFTGTWLESKKGLAKKINTFIKLRVTNQNRAKIFRKYVMKIKEI